MQQNDCEKRFRELHDRAFYRNVPVFSEFLNTDEQSTLLSMQLKIALFGGYANAERRVAAFSEQTISEDFPIVCVKIEPLNQKFADSLSHRDFLGSLMGLGIRRETLGDIVIEQNVGYLFCLDTIADYIVSQLTKVRHTSVKCTKAAELPALLAALPEETELIVSSLRADVLIAGVFRLSRSTAEKLFRQEKVFVDGRAVLSPSFVPNAGSVLSVRGFGRFICGEELRRTKKDRIVLSVRIY